MVRNSINKMFLFNRKKRLQLKKPTSGDNQPKERSSSEKLQRKPKIPKVGLKKNVKNLKTDDKTTKL